MNALAAVATGTELGRLTLWSSHRPCQMCAAACAFTGVGSVSFIAPDPSDEDSYQDPGGIETEWVVASLLFLSGVAAYSGGNAASAAGETRRSYCRAQASGGSDGRPRRPDEQVTVARAEAPSGTGGALR